jgi:hypothetical protein
LPCSAHHSAQALYHLDRNLVVVGVVTEYQFSNPHARILLDITTADGQTEAWLAEGGTPNVLRRFGWNGQEVQPGDRVTIAGNPARDGSNLIHWVTITLPDGSELHGEDINFGSIDRRRQRQ